MRGKVGNALPQIISARITPAYAGKSQRESRKHQRETDHPRLCGEKLSWFGSIDGDKGSPPPMRGKDQPQRFSGRYKGITPAYAGKRPPAEIIILGSSGSPPPMRGKGKLENSIKTTTRITPAYAGKSFRNFITVV